MNSLLQTLLLVNAFLVGAALATALHHVYAHFRLRSKNNKPQAPAQQQVHLPQEIKEHLLETAKNHFQKILDHSADELETSLKTTVSQLNTKLEKMAVEIVNDEMRRYRMDLDQLRKQTEANISGAQTEVNQHQTDLKDKIEQRRKELEAKLVEDIANEKQVLISQLDTKLADAVASFLGETLGHNVDLGSQNSYLVGLLEEHKTELIKEIGDEG
jgi:F0F1-type ATP synthase membrane subunit b/b'